MRPFSGPKDGARKGRGPYHSFNWRGFVDFGSGALGDMACHTANLAVMAADLFDPVSVVADSPGIVENETFPEKATIRFEFPQRGELPPATMIWYDGGNVPPKELLHGEKMATSGERRGRASRAGRPSIRG